MTTQARRIRKTIGTEEAVAGTLKCLAGKPVTAQKHVFCPEECLFRFLLAPVRSGPNSRVVLTLDHS